MKKTICLITNWYPTKENPFQGLFFKEQIFAVSESYDFVVVHIQKHSKKNIFSKTKMLLFQHEKNTVEYNFSLPVPLTIYIADLIENFKVKHLKKNTIDGVGKYVSNRRKKYLRKALIALFEEFVNKDIDAFYCVDAQLEAFDIQCLAEYYGKPYIVAEHAPVPWPGSVIDDANKYAIEKSNIFFAISNDKIRQLLLQNIKLPEIRYIGNLIDETKFEYKPANNSIKTFIIVAAHSFYKNYDMFVSVMNRLTEITSVDFKVMIVGYASNKGYSKNVEEFENQIKQSNFLGKAIMIPSVPHEKIGETLNKADAFVMTSIQEGQPVSAIEAACCGLPIFSTSCGGVEDYVDGKMGRIYSVVDCDGMARGLKDFLEEKIKFDSKYIREQVVSRFGNKAFVNNFKSAFDMLIEEK